MHLIDLFIVDAAMHADRLNFWTVAYEDEKKLLLHQYNDEMDSYKERKFRAHKELESVHYGLEALADERRKLTGEKHEEKKYEIKSKVSCMAVKLQNHDIVSEIVTVRLGPFGKTVGDGLGQFAFVVASTIGVHVLEHVEALLDRIDEKLLQLNVTDVARQYGQHFEFVRLIVIVRLRKM